MITKKRTPLTVCGRCSFLLIVRAWSYSKDKAHRMVLNRTRHGYIGISTITEDDHMAHTSAPKHHSSPLPTHTASARQAPARRGGHPGTSAREHTAPGARRNARRIARQNTRRKNSEQAEAGGSSLTSVLLSSLFSLPLTLGIGLVLLLVITGIVLSTEDPDRMMTPMAMAVLGVSALLGGIIAARRCGSRPLLCGLCAGLLFTLLLWVLTFLTDRTDATMTLGASAWGRLALHAAVVALETAGGLIGGR